MKIEENCQFVTASRTQTLTLQAALPTYLVHKDKRIIMLRKHVLPLGHSLITQWYTLAEIECLIQQVPSKFWQYFCSHLEKKIRVCKYMGPMNQPRK